jgi:PAS domain S-box-containing protein
MVEELINKNIYSFLPPDLAKSRKLMIDKAFATGEPVMMEDMRNGDYLDSSIYPIFDKLGKVRQVVIYIRDITQHKKAEEALRESEEKFRVLTQESPAIIYLTDKNGKCIFANKNWRKMTGFTTKEAMGDGWIKGLYSDDRELVFKSWGKMVKSRGKWGLEYRMENREGKVAWVYGIASPIHDEKGEISGYVGINMDINERKKAEEELLRAREELEQRVKERTLELHEKNIAMKVLLTQREEDKNELEQNILSNVKSLIQPYIRKLKRNNLKSEDITYLNIIESNLEDIIAPFSKKLSSKYMSFTSREIQIANFIKEGKKDKEIMEIMHIAFDTVKTHRRNIRKKLGIHGKGTNLRNKLLSM